MVELQLDVDEGILLQATDIERYGAREDVLDEMVLTNKNLFFVFEYKESKFSKSVEKVEKMPLDTIKVVNGKVQIMRIDHDDYGDVMQVLYTNGKREFFVFGDTKRDIPKWMNAINTAITGDETPIIEEPKRKKKREGYFRRIEDVVQKSATYGEQQEKELEKKKQEFERQKQEFEEQKRAFEERKRQEREENREKRKAEFSAGVGLFATGIKNVVETTRQAVDEASKKVQMYEADRIVQPTKMKNTDVLYCIECGGRLTIGARFCYRCGTAVVQIEEEDLSKVKAHQSGKCPSCGNGVDVSDATCDCCGMRLRG